MLYRFLSGDFPITIALLLIAALWVRSRPSTVLDMVRGDSPAWNLAGRITVGAAVVLPVWVAVADNWRQLLGYSISRAQRWQSDPYETAATPEALRIISLVLIATVIVGLATMFARHRGTIGSTLLFGALAFGYFYFMNSIRIRLDALMWQSQTALAHPEALGLGFILFWALGLYALIATLIIAAGFVLFIVPMLVAKVLYAIGMHGRQEYEDLLPPLYRPVRREVEAPIKPMPPRSDGDMPRR